MRRLLTALTTLLVALPLAATATATAGPLPDPAPWVLPVNAFAKARPGEWTILEGDAVLGGKPVHEREVIMVGPVVRGVAEVQLFEGKAGRETWFLSFPVDVKRGPDSNLLFDLPWIATDLHVEKASCPLGGATVACSVVTYQTPSHTVTVYMSAKVRGSGIISYEILQGGKTVWAMTAIGYGTAGKVEWGVGPPSAALAANWDGGGTAVGQREGSAPAAGDIYEAPEPPPLPVPPRADLGDCQLVGVHDANIVRRFVLRKLMPIEDCYVAALASKPALGGTVAVAFTIDEAAATTGVQVSGSADPAVSACVSAAVRGTRFPPSNIGVASTVTCAFTFDPGKPAPPAKKPTKPRLLSRAHPARGGPDLRGVTRTQ